MSEDDDVDDLAEFLVEQIDRFLRAQGGTLDTAKLGIDLAKAIMASDWGMLIRSGEYARDRSLDE